MNKTANPSFPFLNQIDIDQDVKQRLSYLLQRTYNGDNEILVSPIAKETDPKIILADLDKVFKANESIMNENLLQLEAMNREKFGPRSIAVPWLDRVKSLDASFESDESDKKANYVLTPPRRNFLRPLTVSNSLKLLKNDTNSGLPYYTRKGKIKERVSENFDELLKRRDPCILFTRTQEQKKTRNVWGFPIADTLNEMRYYSPLLDYQKKLPYRSAINGPEYVSRHLTSIINNALRRDHKLISVDFSAYDTTVRSELQKIAFDYIKELYQPQYRSEIQYIAERFNTIGIITPDGIKSGRHGVPSGSTFTNEVDSIVQASIALSLKLVDPDDFDIQGDDGVYSVHPKKADLLLKGFEGAGLLPNRDKTYVGSDYLVYLQNLYDKFYEKDGLIGGIYPVYRALNRIIYQERWSNFEDFDIRGKDYYSIRTISILENCKYHPLFKELVKVILKYDKYSLDFSDQGAANYVKFISNTQGGGKFLEHQYGDDVSGIKSFATYKMIKELS